MILHLLAAIGAVAVVLLVMLFGLAGALIGVSMYLDEIERP